VRQEPDVRTFARSALERAEVGFIALRALRRVDRIDWDVLDVNPLVRDRWMESDGEGGHRLSVHADEVLGSTIGPLLEAALESGDRVTGEHPLRMPWGAPSWRRVVAIPVGDDVVVALTFDIEDLVDARSRATLLSQHTSDIVAISAPDSGLAWVSPAAEEILGYESAALVGRCAVDLVHPDDVEQVVERFLAVVADPSVVPTVELRLRRADGGYHWFECSIVNRVDDPELGGILLAMHDIDARRRSEDALRRSELRMRSILESAADAIITMDEDGTILDFNRAAERMFKLVAADVVGTNYVDLLPATLEHAALARKYFGSTEFGVPMDLATTRSDGEEIETRISFSTTEIDGRSLITAILRDVTKENEAARALEQRGLYDELTGLATRKLLIDRLDEAIRRARRRGHVVGVLLLDLDRFKHVNDSLGHGAGDGILVEVAHRLTEAAGEGNTVARLSGDMFLVLCAEARSIDEISDRALALEMVLQAPFELDADELMLTASIGIAVWTGGDDRAEALIRNADAAMHRAKERGRGRIELFDEYMRTAVSARLDLESALRRAIERDELVAHYQPIVAFGSGRPTHFEALVRWKRPDVPLVPPDQFIGIAEETGLIHPIGEWMLQRAARDCARWQEFAPGVGVSVNVSPRQFDGPSVVAAVTTALRDSGLAPALLALEITESVLVDDADETVALLEELKALGVRVALDDFGTGYSSLTYLNRLPIDELKIDRSFVAVLEDETSDLVLLQTMIRLGRAFDLRVVAEGIDTDRKLRRIRRLGCHYGQGYLFARPAPFDQVMRGFLEASTTPTALQLPVGGAEAASAQ
jgi:diguanylate cyclase (GGDEF)-like protein/PAS domain S-box-containing protein